MQEIKIKVYSKLNDIEENNEFLAIIDNNLIKYIDLENNKMNIDMENNTIIRENTDYFFNIDFNNNKITITMKKLINFLFLLSLKFQQIVKLYSAII